MLTKTIPADKALAIAVEMHQAGQLARAEMMYVEILRQDPGNVDAIHLLGVVAHQGGRPDVAVTLIGRALSRRPDAAVMHFNLAEAYAADGKPEQALASYRRAVELEPEYFDAHANMAHALAEACRFEEAVAAATRALEIDPGHPVALNNLGNAYRGQGRLPEAAAQYAAALDAKPGVAEVLNNLGLVLGGMGMTDEGIARLREAIGIKPALDDAHNNLGLLLNNAGRFEQALVPLETALQLNPRNANAQQNLATALRSLGRHAEALEPARLAAELAPKSAGALNDLAMLLKELGKLDEALATIDQSVGIKPELAAGYYLRGMIRRDMGRPDEAIADFRAALEREPNRADILSVLGYALQERGELDESLELMNRSIGAHADPQTHSNVMMVMCYHPHVTPRQHLEAHRAYARVHEDPVKPAWRPHANVRDPARRLRVGYISPDMRGHVVSYFSSPIFENHGHEDFEVTAYSTHHAADAITLLQRARFDRWRDAVGMSPDALAEMIRADGIDILVELAGHTALNSLPVLARKPAPVQINGIGFPSTTGLTAVDYRITDARCDPPGAEAYNTEKLLRMPDCFWCYQPPDVAPPVGELPADRNGHVTFLSVNNFTKVTPQVLKTWARIVAAVPRSRIHLQTSGLTSAVVRERVLATFAEQGVAADRVEMRASAPFDQYLRLLEGCDVMLDPFPFNGGTTTCHGLWMGNAVVALEGRMHAGRMGYSMLHCIGLPELCAPDEEAYVATAVGLAGDLPRLREIRAGMRERLLASPLLDAPRYVRHLEAAYRRIWREWCETPESATAAAGGVTANQP